MTATATAAGRYTFPGTDLTVNRLGYGAMQLAGPHVYGPPRDPDAAVAVLREALALGVSHLDTSDFYGPHHTNHVIRRALHPYPDDLVIVTKIGYRRGADASWLPAKAPAELTQQVHDNLRHLGLDAMAIVNLRLSGPDDESLDGALDTLVALQRQGLVRHIGLSNVTAAQFERASRAASIVCVQNEYNLVKRADDLFIDQLASKGIAYVPFFPLGGFTPLQSARLDAAAKALQATPMQVALAWLLQRAPNVLLIPGTSSVAHLRENVAAASLELSDDVRKSLDAIA